MIYSRLGLPKFFSETPDDIMSVPFRLDFHDFDPDRFNDIKRRTWEKKIAEKHFEQI